jgi:D-tyrosyl-tRNA(Tyr) deacylase
MKLLIVRVHRARVLVEERVVSSIEKGMALFVSIERADTASTLVTMAEKIVHLRIFENEKGKLDFSLKDKNYSLL